MLFRQNWHETRLLWVLSGLALKVSKDGDCAAFLDTHSAAWLFSPWKCPSFDPGWTALDAAYACCLLPSHHSLLCRACLHHLDNLPVGAGSSWVPPIPSLLQAKQAPFPHPLLKGLCFALPIILVTSAELAPVDQANSHTGGPTTECSTWMWYNAQLLFYFCVYMFLLFFFFS